jgi:hypothetical protein
MKSCLLKTKKKCLLFASKTSRLLSTPLEWKLGGVVGLDHPKAWWMADTADCDQPITALGEHLAW